METLYGKWLKQSALYAQVERKRLARLEDEARRVIEQALSTPDVSPYLAFSGGKDSLVMLDLVRKIKPDIPISWVYDWHTFDTFEYLDWVELRLGVKIHRVAAIGHSSYEKMFGVQVFYPDFIHTLCETPIYDYPEDWAVAHQHNMVFLGLRKEESKVRQIALSRGLLRWVKTSSVWSVKPIGNWRTEDIWGYLAREMLRPHPYYEKAIDLGLPPKYTRVGGMLAVSVLQYGALEWFKKLYPEDWALCVAYNPPLGDL